MFKAARKTIKQIYRSEAIKQSTANDAQATRLLSTTFRCEQKRAAVSGIIETANTTFLLLIAVRWFSAGELEKSLIAGANSVGLLLGPLVIYTAKHYRMRPSVAAANLYFLSGIAFLIACLIPDIWVFVFCSGLAISAGAATIPLLTQIYQDNYPERVRGRLFSKSNSIRVISAGIFAWIAGKLLQGRIEHFQIVLFVFAICFILGGLSLKRCPSQPIKSDSALKLFNGFKYIKTDYLFRVTLMSWMLMGFGNLMMIPLRVEYLANTKHGLVLDEASIALLVSVVPNLARLLISPIWGILFDRMNFFWMRITVNIGFLLGILSFFSSNSFNELLLGAAIFGISTAGADIAWHLWVTKITTADKVADYMSVHTCLTGIRGVIAPITAFYLLRHTSIHSVAWISQVLILAASLLLLKPGGNYKTNL
jgi:MFS family permease